MKRKNLHRIAAITLLLPALAPLMYYAIFLMAQYSIRNEISDRFRTSELITIRIHEKDLHNGREIFVEGKLFDIEKIQHLQNGDILATGLFDEDETGWTEDLAGNEERNDSDSNLLSSLFNWQGITPENIADPYIEKKNDHQYPADQANGPKPLFLILTPPPRHC